jgi:hypothetical protein
MTMPKLHDERSAANLLGCSVGLLRKFRLFGGGPTFIRIGRLVRYKEEDLISFLRSHRVEPKVA